VPAASVAATLQLVSSIQAPTEERLDGLRRERLGRAVLRAYLNLAGVPDGPATVIFDAARRAGKAMDLAMRVRRRGQVDLSELEAFARFVGMSTFDLRTWCLPSLEAASVVELRRGIVEGDITGIEEQVGVAAPILVQAAVLWESNQPCDEERCAIASSDHLAYAPMGETQHRALLESDGFSPNIHGAVFAAMQAAQLLRRQRSPRLGEDVLYSPYVWGTGAVEIAEFMSNLPVNEREVLESLSRRALESPGSSLEALSSNNRLLEGARKVGLIDSTRVMTTGGTQRGFVFSPGLERQLSYGTTDVAHERKLFVAHILYGHRYEMSGRGRILSPLVLVNALINRGSVGPTTSIREDYPLLEAHGIVSVTTRADGRAYLNLVKRDVAKDSLELLRAALGDEEPLGASNPLDALWLPGTFTSPERDRKTLPEPKPSDEAEVIESTVERLREETSRRLRGEGV
jgi:hypothetical protein